MAVYLKTQSTLWSFAQTQKICLFKSVECLRL